jgi:hypothetical protein
MTDISKLSDSQILELAGPYGPAIIGQELFDRAQKIRARGDDGKLGPAILDSDFAAKQAEKKAAETPAPDPADEPAPKPTPGTWEGITLSGLKQLAMDKGVSYKPAQAKRKETLIAVLEAAGVTPPPVTE